MYSWEMSAFMQSSGQLVSNLSSTGAMLVLLWAILGPTSSILAQLGYKWSYIGVYLTSHEAIWAPTWANQARHGADRRGYGTDLAVTWGQLGSTWAELCHLVANLALISVILGTTWVQKT